MCSFLAERFTEMLRVLLSDVRDARRAAFSLLLLPIWHLLCCSVRAGPVPDTDYLHVTDCPDLPLCWQFNGPFKQHFKPLKEVFDQMDDRCSFLRFLFKLC